MDSLDKFPEGPFTTAADKDFRYNPFRSILIGFGLLGICLLLGGIIGGVLMSVLSGNGLKGLMSPLESDPGAIRITQGVVTLLGFALPAFIWAKMENDRPSKLLRIRQKPQILPLILAGLCVAASIPIIEWIQFDPDTFELPGFLSGLGEEIVALEEVSFKQLLILLDDTSISVLMANILVIALLPAIAEELFFRGFLLRALRRTMGIHVAVWLSAFIFSFIHFQFMGFFSRMVLGAVLGYFYVYSGSLWVSIFAHFMNNFLNVILAFLVTNGSLGEMELDSKLELPGYWYFLSLAVTSALFAGFLITSKRKQLPDE